MTVHRDTTSGIYVPASGTEWTSFVAGTGIGPLLALYQCNNSVSPLVDSVNGINLAGLAAAFDGAVSGWTRGAAQWAETSTQQVLNDSSASLPDLSTTSCAFVLLAELTHTLSATYSVCMMGPGATEANNIVVEYDTSTDHYHLTDGTNTGVGTVNHGAGVVPLLVIHNVTASTDSLFVGYSPEKITKTFAAPAGGSKGLWIGAGYQSTPALSVVWAAALSGVNAELTDAQVTALYGRFVTGYVASIAVTPAVPTLIGLGTTQQMTATATMGDGSTQNVTSNANTVWASSNTGVATVSATGLVTSVAGGTTTITAAYGGVTSAGATTTVAISSTNGLGVTIGVAVGASIGIGVGA